MKKIAKISVAVAVIALCVVTAVFVLPTLLKPKIDQNPTENFRGVLEMWNVEAFEGGSGSRKGWITRAAAKFEKANDGLFVHVTDLTVEQLKSKLENGETADMVAFPRGVGYLVADKLISLDIDCDVRENFRSACVLNGKTYCVPLYTGGYFMFARTSALKDNVLPQDCLKLSATRKVGKNTIDLGSLVCGQWSYGSSLTAVSMSGASGSASAAKVVGQYQAYGQFVANDIAVALLGTQRDLFRLSQKVDQGKIEPLTVVSMNDYTDIAQFVGVTSQSQNSAAAQKFVEYMMSTNVQQTLSHIGLFSALATPIYSDGDYAAAEKNWAKAYVPNVFADEQTIISQRQAALSTLATSGGSKKSLGIEQCYLP